MLALLGLLALHRRFALTDVLVVHRFGRIELGAPIMMVATASSHREAAFAAAEFLMDYLKTSAPFWKKEHRTDGSVGDWVAAKGSDEAAARRWPRRSASAKVAQMMGRSSGSSRIS